MRLLDVLQQTQAHCAALSASRAMSGRTADGVAAMARHGFVRQDFATWFEDEFGGPDLANADALAGLLIAFGLGVHIDKPYKALALNSGLSRLLSNWQDPVAHPEFGLQRFQLTSSPYPVDLDRSLPDDFPLASYSDPAILRFFGAYVDVDDNSSFVEEVLGRILTHQATTLIISRVELKKCQQLFESRSGEPMTFVGVFEGVGLHIYYNSDL